MSNQQLTERLIGSVRKNIELLLESDFVQLVLKKGEITQRNKEIMNQFYKNNMDIMSTFHKLFTTCEQMSNCSEDKEYFKESYNKWSLFSYGIGEFERKFQKEFGEKIQDIWVKPRCKLLIEYQEFLTPMIDSISFIKLVVVLLAGYKANTAISTYLLENSDNVPNPLYCCLTYFCEMNTELQFITNLLNKMSSGISQKDENELFKTFQTAFNFESRFYKILYYA